MKERAIFSQRVASARHSFNRARSRDAVCSAKQAAARIKELEAQLAAKE